MDRDESDGSSDEGEDGVTVPAAGKRCGVYILQYVFFKMPVKYEHWQPH